MKLNTLYAQPGSKQNTKRLGRGTGSGLGKTSGKGHKGQKARSGIAIKAFEGGQMPIIQRLPKRGFKSINRVEMNTINLGDLAEFIRVGKLDQAKITKDDLLALGIVKKFYLPLKLLAKGEFTYPTTIEVDFASARAIEIVNNNGGKVVLYSAAQVEEI
ncbi:MAG: 50S ribosomal protein L15 [Pseudomonadota bacterium]